MNMKSPDTFVSFDIETTGLDPNAHEIIEIGAVKVEHGNIIEEFSEFVKPEKPIPKFITMKLFLSFSILRMDIYFLVKMSVLI